MDKVKRGSLLISQPFLGDPNFERTVILICDHNEEGTFGLVLNQPSDFLLEDVILDYSGIEVPLYYGGPVEHDTLHYIHNNDEITDSVELEKNIFWSGDFEEIKYKLTTGQINPGDIQLFLGYSGWGVGQLDEELKNNSWFVSNNFTDKIFEINNKTLWQSILKGMGGKYKQFAHYPIDPNLN